MMSFEKFKEAFGDLAEEIKEGMPLRDLFIIIARTIKSHQTHNNKMHVLNSERMSKLESRIKDNEVHFQSMEERLRDYLETALVREDAANQRADRLEKRRLPHWTDMPR